MVKAIFNKMNAKTILCTFIILFFMHPQIMAQTETKADYPDIIRRKARRSASSKKGM